MGTPRLTCYGVAVATNTTGGVVSTSPEALRLLLTQHILPHAAADPLGRDFREQRLYNEAVGASGCRALASALSSHSVLPCQADEVFKAHLSDLERAFDTFAGKNAEGVVSKGPKFMSLADFEDLLMLAHLCRDRDEPTEVVTGMQAAPSSYSFTQADTKPMGVVRMTTRRSVHEDGGTPGVAHAVPPQHERVVKMAFAHSIQTVVNPNVSHRQQHLSFVEFIEAVRACASVSHVVLHNATAQRILQVWAWCGRPSSWVGLRSILSPASKWRLLTSYGPWSSRSCSTWESWTSPVATRG